MTAPAPALAFEVARSDLRNCRLSEAAVPELQDGETLLGIERFALTANNITYAVFGEAMQYWNFFPAADSAWGRIPVWGFARVLRSRNPALAEGERIYGYLPMATHLVVQPERIGGTSFMDGSAGRRALPAAYQLYRRVSQDSAHDPAQEDAQALLSPLFITSFLIEDFLADNSLFGARSVVLASASSKTALGVAFRLAQNRPENCEVIGLTSARNVAFCEKLGCYDRVLTYDQLESLPGVPTVYVDMAGDGALLARVHNHFRENLRYSCIVGATHWEQRATQHRLPGAQPQFFFAPSQIKKRTQDWGPGGVDQRFAEAWRAFLPSLGRWLRVQQSPAPVSIESVYREVLEGRAQPETGHVLAWSH